MAGLLHATGWLTLLTAVEAVALALLRAGGLRNAILASGIFALLVVPLLVKSLQFEGLGMINFFWNILSTLTMFAIGIYVFGEKIATLQLIGVCVSFLGIGMVLMAPDAI